MSHLVGFSLLCFMEIALSYALCVACVFLQLFAGYDICLFPMLVWLIAVFLISMHDGFSHRRVGVGYALRVSPAATRLTVYRRP